eukprot:365514-Chlamydomonas_euryale.AAC.6
MSSSTCAEKSSTTLVSSSRSARHSAAAARDRIARSSRRTASKCEMTGSSENWRTNSSLSASAHRHVAAATSQSCVHRACEHA